MCFCERADAVNLDCGHGGICYSCGMDILKKTGRCYLCREPIKQLVQVSLEEDQSTYLKINQAVQLTEH